MIDDLDEVVVDKVPAPVEVPEDVHGSGSSSVKPNSSESKCSTHIDTMKTTEVYKDITLFTF